jgi:hypothetical protein
MQHKVSKEILYHFNCGKCNKWWSIADYHLLSINNLNGLDYKKQMSCPHCQHKETIIDIINEEER